MKKNTHPEELTPWYVNQSLAVGENESYKAWLEGHPEAQDDVRFWQEIKRSVRAQPQLSPAPSLLIQTRICIEGSRVAKDSIWQTLCAIVGGMAVTMIVFVLLWVILKPGTTLQWSVNGVAPASFRIYRAPADSQDYKLVSEISGLDNQIVYHYNDLLSAPGRSYRYRVEGFNSSGGIMASQVVTSDPRSGLLSQFSILITSIIMGYLCLSFLKDVPKFLLRPTDGVIA